MDNAVFERYRSALLGKRVSKFWRGHGSALFLEFGQLTPVLKRDGSPGHPQGKYGLMIEWSWRIENENSILCGSWSEEADWETHLADLIDRSIEDVSLLGRLPEVSVRLSGGRYLNSFMTAEGQPAWVIFDRTSALQREKSLGVENGQLSESEN